MPEKYAPTSPRLASRRLARAITLLHRAGRQLDTASQSAPDHYHRDRLHCLVLGLREIALPLSRIATHLEKGGQ